MAEFMPSRNYSTFEKKPEDAAIKIDDLPAKVRSLLTGKGGSREGERSNIINQIKEKGGPAMKVHRGARPREIQRKSAHRLVPTRLLDN